ncbi:hypothetical protein NPIL_536431, partial [Nephila pilipes]
MFSNELRFTAWSNIHRDRMWKVHGQRFVPDLAVEWHNLRVGQFDTNK